jgi:hypothetical protein
VRSLVEDEHLLFGVLRAGIESYRYTNFLNNAVFLCFLACLYVLPTLAPGPCPIMERSRLVVSLCLVRDDQTEIPINLFQRLSCAANVGTSGFRAVQPIIGRSPEILQIAIRIDAFTRPRRGRIR